MENQFYQSSKQCKWNDHFTDGKWSYSTESSFTCTGFPQVGFKSQHHHLEAVWPRAYYLALLTSSCVERTSYYLLCRVIERIPSGRICNVFSNGAVQWELTKWWLLLFNYNLTCSWVLSRAFLHFNPSITLWVKH